MAGHYQALTHEAGFVELSPRTVIQLIGEDRVTLLQNLSTADIQALQPGQGSEAFFTNVKGKVLGHVFVLCHADSVELDTVGGQAEALISHLDRYIIREDVQLTDRSAEFAHFLISGQRSAACVTAALGEVPQEMLGHVGNGTLVIRSPMLDPPNFLVRVPLSARPEVHEKLAAAGAIACAIDAVDALRIIACFPQYGADISEANLPQEVGRDSQAISFTKGCYLGQETVARLDALGHVNWMLATLRRSAGDMVLPNTELQVEGDVVARTRSSAIMPDGSNVLLAYVRAAHAQSGRQLATSLGDFVVDRVAAER